MEIFGIAIVAAALMGAWHVTKYAVPRAMRAVSGRRRSSIDGWKSAHPGAPAIARWAAVVAAAVAALRWGPRHLLDETRTAWREGFERGRERYGPPTVEPDELVDEPAPVAQPRCKNPGCFCQNDPNFDGHEDEDDVAPAKPAGNVFPLRPVPDPTPDLIGRPAEQQKENTTMPIQTATGGEIVDAEQFLAEAKAIVSEAAAELEDAAGDSNRAQEDFARIEKMVASLTGVRALAADIGAVAALKEPAEARAQAAKDRLSAAEQRLAIAKNVEQIAGKHVQLIGTAAGRFYKAG
jgi:hypothetical protein